MAAAAAALAGFNAALTRIGFANEAIASMNQNQIVSTTSLIGMEKDDVEQLMKIIRGGQGAPVIPVPFMAQKKFTILCYWINRRTRLGESIAPGLFNDQAILQYGRLMVQESKDDETEGVKAPSEFKTGHKWKPFKEGCIAFFNTNLGMDRVPFSYIIREDQNPGDPLAAYPNEHARLIAITPHAGLEYETDNGRVYDHLKSWTLNGPAWTWIRSFNNARNGRAAWLALLDHYEGDAQRDRVKDAAYAAIAQARYFGDRKRFSFETYVTIHQDAYEDLEQYGQVISADKRVRDLLQGIKDPKANAAKETILANNHLRNDFTSAVTHLATSLQLQGSISDTNPRNVSGLQSGRGGGRQGRGRGRGRSQAQGRGRGRGRNIYLGSYSPEQWAALSQEDKQRVRDGRANSAASAASGQNQLQKNTQGTAKRNLSAVTIEEQQQDDVVSALTTGTALNQASQQGQRTDTSTAGQSMSRRQRINSIMTTNRSSSDNRLREIHHVGTAPVVHSVQANCELDSHADTSVAGANFTVIEFTDLVCNVSPFAKSYECKKNIPIVKAVTAYDDEKTGITYILVLGQALYFGDEVETSLLCPNQMRSSGVIVDDVPVHLSHDNSSTHSIIFPDEDMSIPLKLNGCFSYIPTRTPTSDEIESCRWLTLTSDAPWDPNKIPFSEYEDAAREATDRGVGPDRTIYTVIRGNPNDEHNDVMSQDKLNHLAISSIRVNGRQSGISPQKLAKRWSIGEATAAKTLQVTTQKGIRNTLFPIEKRFRTKQAQLRYTQLSGRHGRFYTDTFFSSVPAIDNSTCCQLFANDIGFSMIYPMRLKSEAPNTLKCFLQDVGTPHVLHSDNAKELMQGEWRKICNDFAIQTTYTEPKSPWQNRAEGHIRETKRHIHRKMKANKVPKRLWSYCAKWSCDVRNKTSSNLFALEGRTPYEAIYNHTPDISSLCEFDFYEPVWYYEPNEFPEDKRILGRWLGEAHKVGQAMCYWVLTSTGKPIARSTVQPISDAEMATDVVKAELVAFDESITEKLSKNFEELRDMDIPDYLRYLDDSDDPQETPHYDLVEPEASMPEADDFTIDEFDKYIAAEVLLPKGDSMVIGKVIGRKRDSNDNPIGIGHTNPILDTRLYNVQFPEGHVEEFTVNVIAQNLYSQLDNEGHRFCLMEEIVDYKKDEDALPYEERFVIAANGNIHKKRTTKGWHLCVLWKDGSTSWEALKDMKESFPVQVAEFSFTHGLQDEPAFSWWVKDVVARKHRIIKAMKTRYVRKTHKYGIEMPKSIREAYELDRASGTDFWHRAIVKEMTNNASAFKFLEDNEPVPIGSTWIPCHMVFDIKPDLTRKARFVAGGHWTDPPKQTTYSTVVSRDSVRIMFLIAALNDIDILSADIGNAYLNAPTKERVHTTAGPEFGPNRIGQTVIIIKALYGLKSSGAAWHAVLSESIRAMGFENSMADPDVWLRPAAKENGFDYYEYLIVYVDDILVLSHRAKEVMNTIEQLYRLKEPASTPKTYLGASILEWSISGDKMWAMSSQKYVKEAIRCVEVELQKTGERLVGKPTTPMTPGYRPELDVTPLLDPDQSSYYMSLIGILRWAVELGRIDIYIDVALLSSFMAQPRIGHMMEVLHIFSYLKAHENSKIVFDPEPKCWDDNQFQVFDWSEFYKDAKESVPPNAPPPRGHPIQVNTFVDADHAGNKVTRRSHTGVLIYANSAPIIWYSKAQTTVETSTFGSEYIALKIATEMLDAFRYKLRMFGIPIDGPSNVFCDNQSVVTNSTVPESTLKKKHNAIAYHRVRESVAAGAIRIAYVQSKSNNADILTKPLPGPELRAMISNILW